MNNKGAGESGLLISIIIYYLLLFLLLCTLCSIVGYAFGLARGHAEQKGWDWECSDTNTIHFPLPYKVIGDDHAN